MSRMPVLARPLAALALAAALPLGAGCSSAPAAADCSATATKRDVLSTVNAWYLYAPSVNYTAFDPADPTQTPDQFLQAVIDSAGQPDRGRGFSYLTTQDASAQFYVAGTSLGYGVGLRTVGASQLFVTQVLGGSPAARAGLARGDELLAIAPTPATLGDPASQVAAILAADAVTPGALGAALSSGVLGTTRAFRVLHAGAAASTDLAATTAVFSLDPVPGAAAPVVLDGGGGRKVGYLMLRAFVDPAMDLLRTAFGQLKAQGVTDLIVDLRYDGGGDLAVASTFLDLLHGGHAGSPKFGLRFNAQQAAGSNLDLQYRTEPNAIAATRVAFIVTGASGSASELLPFSLLPDLGADVALVGAHSLGKPVGQAGFSAAGCPTLLSLLSFQLANRLGAGSYFTGLPDTAFASTGASCAADDDLAHPYGDPAEASTAAALQWITAGTCPAGPIPPTDAPAIARAARLAPLAAFPAPTEPTLAQRHVPGLF